MDKYAVQQRQFIDHYMLLKELGTVGNHRRFFGEEMRQGKEVFIDIYPIFGNDVTDLQKIRNLAQMVEKIQKIDTGYIKPIHELVYNDEAFCIVSEPPTGFPLSQLSRLDEHSFKIIVIETARLLQWLQNHGFGINRLSPDDIYFSLQTQSLQLLFSDALCLRPLHESREKEIHAAAEVFFFLITAQKWSEGTNINQALAESNRQEWNDLLCKMIGEEETRIDRIEVLLSLIGADKFQNDAAGDRNTKVPAQEKTIPYHRTLWPLFLIASVLFLYFGFMQIQSDDGFSPSLDQTHLQGDENRSSQEPLVTPPSTRESGDNERADSMPLTPPAPLPQQEPLSQLSERFPPAQTAPYVNDRMDLSEPSRATKKEFQSSIMWQDNDDVIRLKMTWQEATHYCENLHLNGYDDWVLPDKELLFKLFFEQPNLQFVTNDLYWTSSEASSNTAWRIYFDYSGGQSRQGNMSSNSKNDRWFVRCYRQNL